MDNKPDDSPRMVEGIGLFEQLRLSDAEHRLRRPDAPQEEMSRILHELHEALGRLRERAAAKEGRP